MLKSMVIATVTSLVCLLEIAYLPAVMAFPLKPINAFSQKSQAGRQVTDIDSDQAKQALQIPPQFPEPSAHLKPIKGKVTVLIFNNTDGNIEYQLLRDRGQSTLPPGQTVSLPDQPLPVDLTVYRLDGTYLQFYPQVSDGNASVLDVTIGSTAEGQLGNRSLNIQQTGSVFLY